MTGLIYIASPYSDPDPDVREMRWRHVCAYAASLMSRGLHVISPIAHTHPIALAGGLPKGWDYWEEYDRKLLQACSSVRVLRLDGWRASKGVSAEINIATSMGMPVTFADLEDYR